MSSPIISVENLSKSYTISHQSGSSGKAGGYRRLSEELLSYPRQLLSRFSPLASRDSSSEEFWALKEVSFEVTQGEVVGIIGRNGAGKSTLLKILSRITEPTSGRVTLRGRVASLLEVGTGFHPELTGRENVFLNGAILGMTRLEIQRKFDEIVEFAGVEKFLDTPVKRYSSGMYVRLAFAVAAHLEPEILVVDEVLAVGDAEFQKKCLGKMQDVAQGGRTVLFVSHNIAAIRNLCAQCVLLQLGQIIEKGETQKITEFYLANTSTTLCRQWPQCRVEENDLVAISNAIVSNQAKTAEIRGEISVYDPVGISFDVESKSKLNDVAFEIIVNSAEGVLLFHTFTETFPLHKTKTSVTFKIPGHLLNEGVHYVSIAVTQSYATFILKVDDAISFEIVNLIENLGWSQRTPGVIRPNVTWSFTSV